MTADNTRPADGVTAGDAVFAFAGLLTSLPHVVPFGAAAWATPGADLAAAFNAANGLKVSRDFPQGLVFPKIEGELLDRVKQASDVQSHERPAAGEFVMVPRSELERVIHELRTYNPIADEYKGVHIHSVWARELESLSPAPQQHGQEAFAFVNRGDSEDNFIADGEHLNCPACGGSGHVDDVQTRQSGQEVVAEYQYRNPGAHDDSWHRMTREEYEASLATGHCCGIASWTKNFELRKLYTTQTPAIDIGKLRHAADEVAAWFRSGNTVPVDLSHLFRTKWPKLKEDIDKLLALIGDGGEKENANPA